MGTYEPRNIAELEERRQALGTSEVAREAVAIGGGFMCFSEPGSWSNQAFGLGLDGPMAESDLDALVAFYEQRGVEARVHVTPFADATLVLGLGVRGFRLEGFTNVFARPLGAGEAPIATPAEPVSGLTFERVDPRDDAQVRTFVEASTSGFRSPEEPLSEALFAITKRMVDHPRCTAVLARVEGEPAGGGFVEVLGAVGTLFGASVLPRYRRRGVQQALMARRLAHAQEAGCKVACIQSRPGVATERNAVRLGFWLAYTKVTLVRALGQGEPAHLDD